MELTTTAFADNGVIPPGIRVRRDGRRHAREAVRQSQSRFPLERIAAPARDRWRSLCHDPDVPSRGDDVNKEGRIVPASLPRVDFFHWVLVDLPSGCAADRARRVLGGRHARAESPDRMRREMRGRGSTTTRAGSPATRTWRATTSATTARVRRGTTCCRITMSSRCTRSTSRGSRRREYSPAPMPARPWRDTFSPRRP